MPKIKFTRRKYLSLLRLKETGIPVIELCKRQKISRATFYNWMTMLRIEALEKENKQLKKELQHLRSKKKTLINTPEFKIANDNNDQELFETVATIIADTFLNNDYNNFEELLNRLKSM